MFTMHIYINSTYFTLLHLSSISHSTYLPPSNIAGIVNILLYVLDFLFPPLRGVHADLSSTPPTCPETPPGCPAGGLAGAMRDDRDGVGLGWRSPQRLSKICDVTMYTLLVMTCNLLHYSE
jgi:hypothetical protein